MQCCSPEFNGGGGWGIFNAILGWNNTGTYGSIIAYNVYWIFVIGSFIVMRFREVKGHWPFMKAKHVASETSSESGVNGGAANGQGGKRAEAEEKPVATS